LIDKRQHTRYAIALEVELVDARGRYAGRTRDLSVGGMFVCTADKLAFGSHVGVSLLLPAMKEHTLLDATVRWQTEDGVGLCFRSLRARHVWALNALFKQAGLLR
jgi:Tfp pilus assembly protein PilZ